MIDATLEVGDAFGVGDDLNAGLQSAKARLRLLVEPIAMRAASRG